ncbi:unnamed protein product [Rotaria socialis]|uniref:G-protein coupled receptors family 1 profile domain-containing protein n=1 Tax=Rotaria socialis TaxID=392032 RepID=A0A818ATA6_9BILA|nr:unnamed protein product [Rotaria socialis]CAF3357294.1 unnamed protein product [Rotaria socialis]CAF3408114.1 unnamed protein product [Rotaria socialis]CAF3543964.1 unnamed protein product [Rotaria socialis]CAF3692310.1 unnamed protein product [Rotaria socialis]
MELNNNIHNTTITGVFGDDFKLGLVKICLFSTFFVLGLIGNSLVLIGIGLNKGMQTSTNLLIFNLAVADVLFIIFCIPTTLFSFFGRWPFTDYGCKLAQFINHLSAFISIYLLVFMSIDRYFAVVHAIDSISSYRTTKNTTICIMALWFLGIIVCIPIGSLFTVIEFTSPAAMYCLLRYLQPDASNFSNTIITSNITEVEILPIEASIYWLGFVIFLYALPLTVIVILYGLMLKFLRGARGQSVGKSKRRATRMILAVILTYALCWFFMQLLFISNVILSRNTGHHFARFMDILTMFANIFAYLNSCTNPILYGFMSKNFRSSFIDLLCCHYPKQNIFCINESLRNRRMTDNNYSNANNLNSMYYKSDYLVRSSVVSHFSQLTPMITANGRTTSSSLSPAANEIITNVCTKERQDSINRQSQSTS